MPVSLISSGFIVGAFPVGFLILSGGSGSTILNLGFSSAQNGFIAILGQGCCSVTCPTFYNNQNFVSNFGTVSGVQISCNNFLQANDPNPISIETKISSSWQISWNIFNVNLPIFVASVFLNDDNIEPLCIQKGTRQFCLSQRNMVFTHNKIIASAKVESYFMVVGGTNTTISYNNFECTNCMALSKAQFAFAAINTQEVSLVTVKFNKIVGFQRGILAFAGGHFFSNTILGGYFGIDVEVETDCLSNILIENNIITYSQDTGIKIRNGGGINYSFIVAGNSVSQSINSDFFNDYSTVLIRDSDFESNLPCTGLVGCPVTNYI